MISRPSCDVAMQRGSAGRGAASACSCGARVEADAPEAPADPLLRSARQRDRISVTESSVCSAAAAWAPVYSAHELALDRDVAIKVLPPEQASTPELRRTLQARSPHRRSPESSAHRAAAHVRRGVGPGLLRHGLRRRRVARARGCSGRGRSTRKRRGRCSRRYAMRSTTRTGRASSTATSSRTTF